MKRLNYLFITLVFISNYAYSGGFESIDAVTKSSYTMCDSVVKRDCINLNDNGGGLTQKTYTGTAQNTRSNSYTGANNNYINPNSNSYDKNAIVNFNITNSNQTLMQAYSDDLNPVVTPSEYVLEKVTIPFQTTENTKLNVGTNKVEFNWSY